MLLSIFGVTFGGVGVFGIINERNRLNIKNELFTQQRGKKLTLPIVSVARNTRIKVNGASPLVITAQWTDSVTNISYTFKSESIWNDPGGALADKKNIDVYIDETKPVRYYMDVTFLSV